jgi:hypothetical protein
MRLTKQTKGDYHMKQSIARITILTLIIIGLLMVAYGMTVKPTSTAQAVSNGHIESVSFPSDTQARYAMQNDVQSSLIGDCLSDRVTGDLYPQPDPYCLPVPSVAVVETVKRDTDDTVTPVIVDVPSTPEQPAVEPPVIVPTQEPPVVTPPVVEPEQPEQPTGDKNKCNKGSGNGSEGCDPGNHPENGNNDEGGDRRPENSNGGGRNN